MAPFIYRCPATGRNVQDYFADDPSSENDNSTYEAVICPACTSVHFVNLRTGKTLHIPLITGEQLVFDADVKEFRVQ
jgi:hypothetical protein